MHHLHLPSGSSVQRDPISRSVPPQPWNLINFYASPAKMDPWVPLSAFQPHQPAVAAPPPPPFDPSYQETLIDGSPSDCTTLPGDSGYGSIRQSFSNASASVHGGDDMSQQPIISSLESPAKPVVRGHFCDECNASLKSQGELKKHKQRHLRSHKCPYPNCPKGQRGFSTSNDLVRHKRSVHGEHDLPGRCFVCDICIHGSKGPKVWPRADNFRSHLQRSHKVDLKPDGDHTKYIWPRNDLKGVGDSLTCTASQTPSGVVKSPLQPDARFNAIPAVDDQQQQQQQQHLVAADDETALFTAPYVYQPVLNVGPDHVLAEQASSWPLSSGDDGHVSPMPTPVERGSNWMADETGTLGLDDVAALGQFVGHATASAPLPGWDPSTIIKYLMTFPKPFLQTALRGDSSDDDAGWKCLEQDCGKTFNRPCELKKHTKRHEKPYGCTFRGCSKRFGSKNDWKRHESSQHLVLEKWDCDEPGCGRICHRRESFKNHLQKDHGMRNGGSMEERVDSCRLGRHCDASFWCGFCVQVIDMEVGGNSWTKRCDHIDNHLCGKEGLAKKTMAEWKHQEDGERKRSRRRRNKAVKTQTYMWACCRCCTTMNLKTSSSCFECHHVRCERDCLVEHVEAAESDEGN